MALAVTYSRASIGIEAPLVTVETHISSGLPSLNIVGLPETVVKESKDRVRSAILNSHFDFPSRRITINLAPADLPKQGGRYDLPIAIGILAASKQIPPDSVLDYELAGELALSGELRQISGILAFAIGTRKANKSMILPKGNLNEAQLLDGISLLPANHLLDVCSHFLGRELLQVQTKKNVEPQQFNYLNLNDVRGQYHAKRALEIAAAGQHSLLLIGPPGVGKTMLSHCLPGLLPQMSEQEATELAAIQSVAGLTINQKIWRKRPFRAPHHSASMYALVGGGSPPRPGEISLAHQGVLFLDELPEFKRQALEALRQPLESGQIHISRVNGQISYPARFQLITAMNPCPCGHLGNQQNECQCSPSQVKKYQSRLSGPLLDRIDLQAELHPLPAHLLLAAASEESSEQIAKRVAFARNIQMKRANKLNASLSNGDIDKHCQLGKDERSFLEAHIKQQKISARSYHKILKLAQTIADLEQTTINMTHLKEALSYRSLEHFKL